MKIERERVRETFREYTDAYDATDEKIKLKIDHTYRVAELCERIAKAEQMEKTEVDLAWLLECCTMWEDLNNSEIRDVQRCGFHRSCSARSGHFVWRSAPGRGRSDPHVCGRCGGG